MLGTVASNYGIVDRFHDVVPEAPSCELGIAAKGGKMGASKLVSHNEK